MTEREISVRVTTTVNIKISDEDKAAAVFCADGEWRSSFYPLDSTDDAAEHIATLFTCESSWIDNARRVEVKSMEGYGPFERHFLESEWKLSQGAREYFGFDITISVDDYLEAEI